MHIYSFMDKYYKLKYSKPKVITFINFISLSYFILLIQTLSLQLKKTHYYIMDSEIIIKFLRKNTYQIINDNFLNSIISIDVNGKIMEKNTTLTMDKYRNIVRMKMDSLINNCYGMFQNCKDIVEIDLSHFDASHVTDMGYMFSGCSSLTSINFTNFDTSSVTFAMHWMFSGCNKLYSLDLSGFNTRTVECMENMFENCYSLTSLNLNNFVTSGLKNTADLMFSNCSKLEYINLYNAFISDSFYKSDMFNKIPNNTVFCINPNAQNNFKILTGFSCSSSSCDDKWRESQNKVISSNLNCVSNCEVPYNKYDISNKCYDSCTLILFLKGICKIEYEDKDKFIKEIIDALMNGELTELLYDSITKGENIIGYNENEIIQISTLSSQNKSSDMRPINFGEYKYILDEQYGYDEEDELIILKIHNKLNNSKDTLTDYILFSPDGKERLDLNLCKIPNVRQYNSSPNDTFLDYCYLIKFIQNQCKLEDNILNNLENDIIDSSLNGPLNDLILNKIENNEVLIAENDKEIYQISTLSNQLKVRNSTFLDFGECEYALKQANNISENEELILLKIEHNFTEIKIPIVEYVIFSPDCKKKLDLNVCKNIEIHQFIEVDINEDELFKYDPNGDYYNDKCYTYSENGIDKIIFDRKKEFNEKNMSLCEKNCNFNGYDATNKYVDCECHIKESLVNFHNVTINTDSLVNIFY